MPANVILRFTMALFLLVALSKLTFGRDLNAMPLKLEGTAVETEQAAQDLAFNSYVNLTHIHVRADEGPGEVKIVTLGYDIEAFAKAGDQLWEVRIMTLGRELRAIVWINPRNAKVHFLTAPQMP